MGFLRPIDEALQPIEAEVNDKLTSSLRASDFSRERFVRLSHERLAQGDQAQLLKTLQYAESLPSRDPNHPSMTAYFAHPIRVAEFVLRLLSKSSVETIIMGLLHNVFEVSGVTETDLVNTGVSRRIADGVRLLTIDRERQYDPVYLSDFYNNIEIFGSDLALVKCIDRLDNLLVFDVIERTDKLALYMDLTERFVTPMAKTLASDFGEYFQRVLNRMRDGECNHELRNQYQSFLKIAD